MKKRNLTETSMVIALAGSFCFANVAFSQSAKAPLEIEVTGLKNGKGLVVVQLYDKSSAWNTSRPSEVVSVPIVSGKSIATFSIDPSNSYAVQAFHDENTNNKLDENLLKIPKEGVGLSNNPKLDHNPKFEEISVKASNSPIQIALKYF